MKFCKEHLKNADLVLTAVKELLRVFVQIYYILKFNKSEVSLLQ